MTPIQIPATSNSIQNYMEQAQNSMGFVSNDLLLMTHCPDMLEASSQMIQTILGSGQIDPGLKRMMGYISSTAAGCQYCSAHTSHTALRYGIEEDKLKEAWNYQQSELFSPAEKVALELARKSAAQPNAVETDDLATLQKYYSDAEIVELTFTLSLYAFLNRFNSTLQTPIEDIPKTSFDKIKKR